MEQYQAFAEGAQAIPIQAIFEFLAKEETELKNELEKKYYQIVRSVRGGIEQILPG